MVLYPLIWLLLSSFKTTEEFNTGAFWALPIGVGVAELRPGVDFGHGYLLSEQHPRGVPVAVSDPRDQPGRQLRPRGDEVALK